MTFASQSSRFNNPDYIRWTVQTMKFLIVEPSPLPILIPLGPKYSPKDPILNTLWRGNFILFTIRFLEVSKFTSLIPLFFAMIVPNYQSSSEVLCDLSEHPCCYSVRLLASRQTSKLEDHSWSAVDCLFNIFAANLWKPTPPSATQGTLHAVVTETHGWVFSFYDRFYLFFGLFTYWFVNIFADIFVVLI